MRKMNGRKKFLINSKDQKKKLQLNKKRRVQKEGEEDFLMQQKK